MDELGAGAGAASQRNLIADTEDLLLVPSQIGSRLLLANLLKSAVYTSGAKLAGLGMGVLTLGLTSRVLGPDGRGELVVLLTYATLIATVGHLSLGQVALAHAQHEPPSIWLRPTLGVFAACTLAVPALAAVTLLLLGALDVAVPFAGVATTHIILAAAIVPLTMCGGYATYLLLALDRLPAANVVQLVGPAVVLVSTAVLLLVVHAGLAGALVAVLLGQAVALLVGGRAIAGVVERIRPTLERSASRRLLAGGAQLHLNAIGGVLFASAAVLVVAHHRGPAEAGYFQLAFQLFAPLLLVPQAITDVLGSKLQAGASALWPLQRRLILLSVLALSAVAIALAAGAPLLVTAVAGEQFRPAIELFRIYLLGVPGAALNGGMAIQWIGRGLFKQISAVTLLAGVVTLVCVLLTVPRFGAHGAAWVTVAGIYIVPGVANTLMWVRCQKASRERESVSEQSGDSDVA